MEKFSRWRDKGTGITPFMPIEDPPSSFLSNVYSNFQVAIKLPIYYIVISLYKTVLPIKSLLSFTLSFLFGLGAIDVTVDGLKKSKLDEIDAEKPDRNNVIISNYVSPLTPLIIESISKTRNIVYLIPDSNGDYYEYSTWSTFSHALNKEIGKSTSSIRIGSSIDFSNYKGKLVVILAEGTPSNNRAILPFASTIPSTIPSIPESFKFKVLLIKISPISLTTPLPLVTEKNYLMSLLSNSSSKGSIKAKIYNTTPSKAISCFETNQLIPVGKDLSISEKKKFFEEYLKVKSKRS